MCFVRYCVWFKKLTIVDIYEWSYETAGGVLLFQCVVSKKNIKILDNVWQKLVKQVQNDNLKRNKTIFGIVDA